MSRAGLLIVANYNPNLIKLHRSYTFDELAAVFGIHKNTVATWVKKGLPCLNERRPFLILGAEARLYLRQQRTVRKKSCKPDELYCVRCKAPSKAAERFVEYLPLTPTKGRLTGFCERCEGVINKFASCESLQGYSKLFDLALPKGMQHINDSDCSPLNSDFKK